MSQNIMPVKEYAAKRGRTVQAIYHSIRKGKTPSRKIGSFIFVVTDSE